MIFAVSDSFNRDEQPNPRTMPLMLYQDQEKNYRGSCPALQNNHFIDKCLIILPSTTSPILGVMKIYADPAIPSLTCSYLN